MKGEICSFDAPPLDGESIHQVVDQLVGVAVGARGELGVADGGGNVMVAEDFLHLKQINPGLDQVGCIAMS